MDFSKSTTHHRDVKGLDIQGILVEESQNLEMNEQSKDPFQRKLREKVFLAEVAFTEKFEKEKAFRVSEVYLGSDILSDEEIVMLKRQRQELGNYKLKCDYQQSKNRKCTEVYPSSHSKIHAGASLEITKKIQELSDSLLSWDINSNDVWNKRNNTLKRFIGLVTKWIVRNRVEKIKRKLIRFLIENNLQTKEAVKLYVEQDYQNHLNSSNNLDGYTVDSQNISQRTVQRNNTNDNIDTLLKPKSLAYLFLGAFPTGYPNKMTAVSSSIDNSNNNSKLPRSPTGSVPTTITTSMSVGEDSLLDTEMKQKVDSYLNLSSISTMNSKSPTIDMFNTNTIHAKSLIESDKIDVSYVKDNQEIQEIILPPLNLVMPYNIPMEPIVRSAADSNIKLIDLIGTQDESDSNSNTTNITSLTNHSSEPKEFFVDSIYTAPSWMVNTNSSNEFWNITELDHITPKAEYRIYLPEPDRCEMDEDWILRPLSQEAVYVESTNLRSQWLKTNCFRAINTYLLDNIDPRSYDPISESQVYSTAQSTLPSKLFSYVYHPDDDRHISGLMCFANDHSRPLFSRDYDMNMYSIRYSTSKTTKTSSDNKKPYLLMTQDPNDYLTESESDDEELYGIVKPSASSIQTVLSTPIPIGAPDLTAPSSKGATKNSTNLSGKKSQTLTASTTSSSSSKKQSTSIASPTKRKTSSQSPSASARESSVAMTTTIDNEITLSDMKSNNRFIVLDRDRQHEDFERAVRQKRYDQINEISNKLKILSNASLSLVNALPVQMPFHSYQSTLSK